MRALLAIVVVFALAGLSFIPTIMGNPTSYALLYDNTVITPQSPQSGATYNVQTIPLYFTIETNNKGKLPTCYILNNQTPIDVPVWIMSKKSLTGLYGDLSNNYTFTYQRYTAVGNTVLKNLPNGKYNLTIERYNGDISNPQAVNSTTTSFTIDTTKSQSTPVFSPPPAPYPVLTLNSPKNKTYVAAFTGPDYKTGGTLDYVETGVNFESNVLPSWVGYSIDGGANKTVPIYDGIQVKLPLGSHYFTLFSNDTLGNWAVSQKVYFSVITFKDYVDSGQQTAGSSTLPSPTVPESSGLIIIPLFLSLLSVALIVRHRKTAKG